MNIGEKWKKTVLNKWLVYEKEKQKHCFLLIKLYPKIDRQGKVYSNGTHYNGYHAIEKKGSVIDFKYLQELPTDLEAWGKCSYLNDAKLIKKLSKKLTKHLLRDEEAFGSNIFVFKDIFEVGNFEHYYSY